MRFLICTVPLREAPSEFPPLAITRILSSLHSVGYTDNDFYNLDYYRHDDETIIEYFRESNPDIIGISAVVSTSYRYVKNLSHILRKHFPDTPQILGGNMAASSEIILKKMPIDVCASGPSDNTIIELFKHWEKHGNFKASEELKKIQGLAFLEEGDSFREEREAHFTGFAPTPPMKQFDFDLLKHYGADMDFYMPKGGTWPVFSRDPRSEEPHRLGKRRAHMLTTNGCVARCTFCHRWTKGYEMFGVDDTIEYIRYLMEEYNVGYVVFADENFGSSRKQLEELVEKIKPLDILWSAAGVRVRSVDREILTSMKEAGCVSVYYGIESGSESILKIMEKGSTVELNLNAIQATQQAGLYTIIQLVVGMPGESNETIGETIEFLKKCLEFYKDDFKLQLSINYAQALPGTPLYEYSRNCGSIGKTLDGEEAYLLEISDLDAADGRHYHNVSQESLPDVLTWLDRIKMETNIHYHFDLGMPFSWTDDGYEDVKYKRGDYFRLSSSNPIFVITAKYFAPVIFPLLQIIRLYQKTGSLWGSLKILNQERSFSAENLPIRSLRKTMRQLNNETTVPVSSFQSLRDGR